MTEARLAAVTAYQPSSVAGRREHTAAPDEFASDEAIRAAELLRAAEPARFGTIDFVILCTQTPDFPLPTTACLVQDALALPRSTGALDLRGGDTAYVYGLGLAQGLVASRQAVTVLLLTADVPSKVAAKSGRATVDDAATATLITSSDQPGLIRFAYGAGSLAGSGADDPSLAVMVEAVAKTLNRTGWAIGDVDHFILPSTDALLGERARKKLGVEKESIQMELRRMTDAGPSSVPLSISGLQAADGLAQGDKVVIVGTGADLTWAGASLVW